MTTTQNPQQNNTRLLGRGMLWKMASTVTVAVFGFAMSVILNRHYGRDTYAMMVMVITVASFGSAIADLGAKCSLNRFVPKYLGEHDANKAYAHVRAAVILQVTGVIFFSLLMLITAPWIARTFYRNEMLIPMLYLGVFYLAFFVLLDFSFWLLRSFQLWFAESLANIVYPVCYLLFVLVGITVFHMGIQWVLVANALAAVCAIIVAIICLPPEVRRVIFSFSGEFSWKDELKPLFHFGLPLLLLHIDSLFINWFDKALMGRYHSPGDLTCYFIAFLFYNSFMKCSVKIIYLVFMPYLALISGGTRELLRQRYHMLLRIFLHLTNGMIIILYFIIGPIVTRLYGAGYEDTILAFRLLLIIFFMRGVWQPSGMFIQNVLGKSKEILIYVSVGTIVWAGLLMAWVPAYGYKGAIAANFFHLFSIWVVALIIVPEIRRMLPLRLLNVCVLVMLSLGVITWKGYLAYGGWLGQMCLSVIFYLGCMKLFGEIKTRHYRFLWNVAKQTLSTKKYLYKVKLS